MPSPDALRSLPWHLRWLYALKPASWAKLLVPMLLGIGLGLATADPLPSPVRIAGAVAWCLLHTVALLAFVVLLNDWGDREVDALKRRMFPAGCSPKTIPDRILPAAHLLWAGLAAGACAVVSGFAAAEPLDRPALGPAAAAALAVFVAYTLPPVRLNYRGGGELLEAAGVGFVLPALCAYAVGGAAPWSAGSALPWLVVVAGWAPTALASAVASGLADEESDRRGGKRTFASLGGNRFARRTVEGATWVGVGAWTVLAATFAPQLDPVVAAGVVLAAAWVAFHTARRLRPRSAAATTNAFPAIAHYKAALHGAIQGAGAILAAASAVAGLVPRSW